MEYLSVAEYAKLSGQTSRTIRWKINEGKLSAVEGLKRSRGGVNGISYRIPVDTLEPRLRQRYEKQKRRAQGITEPKRAKPPINMSLEDMTEKERVQVATWKRILAGWKAYRTGEGHKAVLDQEYVEQLREEYPEMKFSVRILQRQDQAYREQGEAALIDRRGKHENHKKAVPDEVFEVFMSYYLDESKKSVQKCMRLTETYLLHEEKEGLLPLASRQSFTRRIMNDIPPAVIVLCREGMKACTDKMLPYIRRTYDDLCSNDIWVCDNHTFDVFVNDGVHEKPIRVYLTAFQDVRSRKFMGWYVTLNPCSQATLTALRRGIEAYGIPRRILSDNGREFLTFDIGGRGFRRSRKEAPGEHEIPTILDHMGIEFRTAMVRNARAKIIERAFLDVKNDFSKMFEGYTGGTIAERPERLKKTGKDAGNFTLLPEFVAYVDKYITGIFNKHKHNGVGMRGKSPDEVYAACLHEQRVAGADQLNLMMLRNSRMQKVKQEGVYLELLGEKLLYNSGELNMYYIGQRVYLRYDPDHLDEVRVYDEKDRFIGTAKQQDAVGYFASKEEVAEHIRENRKYTKAVQNWKDMHVKKMHNEMELLMWQAERNLQEDTDRPNPKIIRLVSADEETERELSRAAGCERGTIDYTDALMRLREAKEN